MAMRHIWRRGGREVAASLLCSLTAFIPVLVRGEGATPSAAPPTDPRVVRGASFALDFPNLPKTRPGGGARMNVQLPGRYDPGKLYPLIAWMDGGDGGSSPGAAAELVDKDRFICVGLPFPAGCNNPRQGNMVGNFPEIWKYHRAMLEELRRIVPNLSPRLRILAGFSNGGHVIAGYLPMKDPDVLGWFNVYVPVEGSYLGGTYERLAGRYICVGWGDAGGTNKREAMVMAEKARNAGMKVMCVPQPGVGHAFGGEAKKKVKEWINDVVIAGTVTTALEKLERERDYGAGKSVEVLVEGTAREGRFKEVMARLEEAIRKEYEPIKARIGADPSGPGGGGTVEMLLGFARKYRYSAAANECEAAIEKIAREEVERLNKALPGERSPAQTKALVDRLKGNQKKWEGTRAAGVYEKAIAECEKPGSR